MPKDNINEINKATRFTTGKQQVETARKGGIASAKKKKEQKLLKSTALMMLNALLDESTEKARLNKENIKKKFGLKAGDLNYNSAIIGVQIGKALQGDLKSARWLQEVTEQIADKRLQLMGKDGEPLNAGFTIEVIDKREQVEKKEDNEEDTNN